MFKFATFHFSLFVNYYVLLVDCSTNGNEAFVSKRQTGYQMCMDTFDIYEDKVIRTLDSMELGAKHISERDVPSRDHCYQLCCDTDKCDVFVFEGKRPGSCYLFECGPPDDFKCKFTKHRNYTIGVSKRLSELETQIKFTQHERELANLRGTGKSDGKSPSPEARTTPAPRGSKELVPDEIKHEEKPVEKCSKYQFECHTSHECIAIYNACNGIPQCADGSDEAPELGCPKQDVLSEPTKEPSKSSVVTPSPLNEGYDNKEHPDKSSLSSQLKKQHEIPPQHLQYATHQTEKVENDLQSAYSNNYLSGSAQRQVGGADSRLGYGREGEGVSYRSNPDSQWMNGDRSYHQNQQGGNPHIFNHKESGIITQNERYPPPHSFPDAPVGSMGYNNELPSNEYMKLDYYGNPQYRPPPPNQYNQPSWQPIHKNAGDESMVKNERYPSGGMMPPELYYDENNFRNRQQMMDNRPPAMNNRQPMMENNPPLVDNRQMMMSPQQHPESQQVMPGPPPPSSQDHLQAQLAYENRAHLELTNLVKSKQQQEVQKSIKESISQVTSTVPTTTVKTKFVKEEHHHQLSHIKFEKLTADAAFAPSEIDGHNTSPSGAILSLTFGLLMTAVMVVLVGCRIRTVRRRLRRGGKPFAHDADFLVNGMYL